MECPFTADRFITDNDSTLTRSWQGSDPAPSPCRTPLPRSSPVASLSWPLAAAAGDGALLTLKPFLARSGRTDPCWSPTQLRLGSETARLDFHKDGHSRRVY